MNDEELQRFYAKRIEAGRATDIDLRITVEFTATMIIRCSVIKDEATARALALELHEIIGLFRGFYSARPPYEHELLEKMPDLEEIEETDLVLAIWRTAFDISAFLEGEWLYDQFERVGADELYERYLRLCDKINGTAVRREGAGLPMSGDKDLVIAAKMRDGKLPSPTWVKDPELEVRGYFLFKLRLAGFAAANYTDVQVTRSRLKTGADIDERRKSVIGVVVLTWVADGETWGVARILLEEGPILGLAAGELKAEPVYGAARVESIALVRDKERQP